MLVLTSLVLGFAMFGTFRGLDLVWLHLTPMRPCLNITIWEASRDARLLRAYPFLFCFARCYTYHACLCTCWRSMHLYTLAYMFMHESCLLVCRPCFNTMKLWTFDPNLYLFLADTTFCLLSCLFALSLVCLLSYFFACHVYYAYLLYAYFICSLHLFLLLLVC